MEAISESDRVLAGRAGVSHERTAARGQSDGGYLNLFDLLAILRRRRRFIVLAVMTVTGLAAAVAYSLDPTYTASSMIALDPSDTRLVNTEGTLQEKPVDRAAIETQIDLLKSRSFAARVVSELSLLDDPEFNPALRASADRKAAGQAPDVSLGSPADGSEGTTPTNDEPAKLGDPRGPNAGEALLRTVQEAASPVLEQLPDRVRTFVTGKAKVLLTKLSTEQRQPVRPLAPAEVLSKTIDRFLSKLSIDQSGRGYTFAIRVSSENPEKAAKIANAVAQLYLDWSVGTTQESAAQALGWLENQVVRLRQELAATTQEMADYRQTHQLADDRRDDPLRLQMVQLNTQLTEARVERAAADARLNEVRGLMVQGPSVAGKVLNSPLLATLRGDEATLLRELAELTTTYSSRHPKVLNMSAQIASTRGKIEDEVYRIVQDLANEAAVARARERQLEAALANLQASLSRQSEAAGELNELEQELDAGRGLYVAAVNRLKILQGQQQNIQPMGRVISTAATPTSPSFPKPKLLIAAGFVSSSTLSVLLAFLFDGLDTRLRSSRRVWRVLGVPNLAHVPLIERSALRRTRKPFRYLQQKPQSAFAEALRAVYTGCNLSSVDHPPQVVILTSSLPGEGKTTLALCLGATAASLGRRTAVIDLDLHRSAVQKAYGVRRRGPMLTEYLSGECTLDEIVQRDNECPGLDVIGVDRRPGQAAGLLNSARMHDFINELRYHYDFVVLDTPPILSVNDTKLLINLADAVLFVIRWGHTKEDTASTAVEQLVHAGAPIVGAVLNQVDVRRHARGEYGDSVQYYKQHKRYYVN